MTERRRVSRREPIEVELLDGEVIEAIPLPWQERNDLGDLVIQTYIHSISAMVGAVSLNEDGSIKGGTFDDKAMDWKGLLELSFPSVDQAKFAPLDIDGLRFVMMASLEVNGLEHLGYMIDPNVKSPGTSEAVTPETSDGVKTTSTPDSGSLGTEETKSSN